MDPNSTDGGPNLLRFLAVGRLVSLPDGRWADGKHQILCYHCPRDDHLLKQYKAHTKAIMNKGANKLQPGKRIRLTSDNNDYDLHVLADVADEGSGGHTLIFFAITDVTFAKHHTVSALLRDLKRTFYETTNEAQLTALSTTKTTSGGLQRQLTQPLTRLYDQYNTSRLRDVQHKVDKVKTIMKENVDRALTNVEHLEELEEKSEQFQEHAKQFSKNSTRLKQMFRCRYYKITGLLCLLVCAVVAYIIYAIYSKVHG